MKFNCGPSKAEKQAALYASRPEWYVAEVFKAREWQDFFAWKPVRIDGVCYWLETVQRRCLGGEGWCENGVWNDSFEWLTNRSPFSSRGAFGVRYLFWYKDPTVEYRAKEKK